MGNELPTIEEIETVWNLPEDPDPPAEWPVMEDCLKLEEHKHECNDHMNAWKLEVDQFTVDQACHEKRVEILL